MVRTLSIAICLAAALAASANAAHAGFLNNANKVTGQVVKLEKLALKTPMTAGERLKFQGRFGRWRYEVLRQGGDKQAVFLRCSGN